MVIFFILFSESVSKELCEKQCRRYMLHLTHLLERDIFFYVNAYIITIGVYNETLDLP